MLYPSKEKYNVMIKDLAYGAFTLVYSLASEPIRKGNILQMCQPLVSYIKASGRSQVSNQLHQELAGPFE